MYNSLTRKEGEQWRHITHSVDDSYVRTSYIRIWHNVVTNYNKTKQTT